MAFSIAPVCCLSWSTLGLLVLMTAAPQWVSRCTTHAFVVVHPQSSSLLRSSSGEKSPPARWWQCDAWNLMAFERSHVAVGATTNKRSRPLCCASSSSSVNDSSDSLSNAEIRRYSRHLVLGDVGMRGQLLLKQARVLVIGAGGLGSPLLLYLAAAGIGGLGIVDADTVDESNLQRQIIHGVDTVGQSKCDSAQQRIANINPHVQVRLFREEFTAQTATRIVGDGFAENEPWDLVMDGSDNFPTKYLIK